MRLPDFLIIGAAKSGTTTLYEYLIKHPKLYLSPVKEPAFFAKDENYKKGLEWYSSLFNDAKPDQICGEASTDYAKCTEYPETATRIAHQLPEVKMIYLMRNPVDRAYAHYRHRTLRAKDQRKVDKTFEKAMQKTNIYLEASNYLMQIENYLIFFPREAFLFILMEDLINEPSNVLKKINSFLNVSNEINVIEKEITVSNSAKQFFEDTIRSKITAPIKGIYGIKELATVLPQNWRDQIYQQLDASFYGQWMRKKASVPPMQPETRKILIEKFREPNEKLAQFLNRDLSSWNQ